MVKLPINLKNIAESVRSKIICLTISYLYLPSIVVTIQIFAISLLTT